MQWLSSTVIILIFIFCSLVRKISVSSLFGGDIEELEIAEYTVLQCDVIPACSCLSRMASALIPPLFQVLYLVFHEGNQRSDDQAKSFFGKEPELGK